MGCPAHIEYIEEIQRLRTFALFPRASFIQVSAIQLAEDGFVFTGTQNTTRCVYCEVVKSDWTSADDIHEVHACMSPRCPMVTKIGCNNKTVQPEDQSSFRYVSDSHENSGTCRDDEAQKNRSNHNAETQIIHAQCDHDQTKCEPKHLDVLDDSGRHLDDSSHEHARITNISSERHFNASSLEKDEAVFIKTTPSQNPPREIIEIETNQVLSRKAKRVDYAVEEKRLDSFTEWPENHHLEPTSLAKCGLFYAGGLRNWKVEDNIWIEHARWFPKCKYVIDTVGQPFIDMVSNLNSKYDQIDLNMVLQNLSQDYCEHFPGELWDTLYDKKQTSASYHDNISTEEGSFTVQLTSKVRKKLEDSSYLGVIMDKPKTKELASWSARFSRFDKWPKEHHLRPHVLCDAGFYCYGDCCRCFYCGGGLRNWELEDDVWVEHARCFPKCGYMRQKAGDTFISCVQRLNQTKEKITLADVMNDIGESNLIFHRDVMFKSDPSVLSVVEQGFNKEMVLDVAKVLYEKNITVTSESLLKSLTELGQVIQEADTKTLTSSIDYSEAIRKENQELREQSLCKICLDEKMEIVFTSCGHLACCTECASALDKCPICRKAVTGKVRVHMG
uniref:RING-type domain-containing protein n=1 Tax=Biomphalaria glabrata TaxID=6526 RepID=A0A182YU70_BIOGL